MTAVKPTNQPRKVKEDQPTVELIIVTWNTPIMVEAAVNNIIQQTTYTNYHITIIDNSSYDETWETVRSLCYDNPKLITAYQTHINRGYGTACNIGAQLTQPKYYLFMNSDVYVHEGNEDWIEQLLTTFKEDDVGIAAPKLLNPEGKVVGHAVLGDNKENNISWYWQKDDGEEFNDTLDAVTLCGAAIMIPSELFHEFHGFDERFFHYYEEKDLIYRLRKEGYRAVCNPDSVLVHEHMGSCTNQNLLSVYGFVGESMFNEIHEDFIKDPTKYDRR
jgi:GT2 family glycosyltransferase